MRTSTNMAVRILTLVLIGASLALGKVNPIQIFKTRPNKATSIRPSLSRVENQFDVALYRFAK